jgi:hypothetical protein
MYKTMSWMKRSAVLAALALVAQGGAARAAEVDNLDAALCKAAPEVVKYLHDKKYGNVGVLKFLVGRGHGPLSDNAGPLNRSLAHRLEVALVLALPDESIRLVGRASDAVAASGNGRATHLTAKGRREFFRLGPRTFQPAWGDGPVQPDAFLTGEARLAPDLRSIRVKVLAFDGKDFDRLAKVCAFKAAVDARTLTEAGVSYARARGIKDDDEDTALAQAPKVPPPAWAGEAEPKAREKEFGEVVSQSPVRLQVLYNGKEVPIKGGAVPTPAEGDKVAFRFKNDGTETYGVVLKVNGKNTLFYEELDALYCYRWILEPGKSVTVEGFQKDDGKREAFAVRPPEESRDLAVQYGEHAGTFSVVVFRGVHKEDEALVKNEDRRTRELRPISRGTLSSGGPRALNLQSLKGELDKQARPDALAREGSRGMIVSGEEGESKIERVSFYPYPRPELSVTIRYHEPPK